MSDIKKIRDEFTLKLKGQLDLSEINEIKTNLFGKNGLISSQFKTIGSINEKERKKFASDLNVIKDELQKLIDSKTNEIENIEINKKLEKEKIDITLPERPFNRRKIHPVSQTIDEISSIFSEIGFSVEEGPDPTWTKLATYNIEIEMYHNNGQLAVKPNTAKPATPNPITVPPANEILRASGKDVLAA